MRYSYTTNRFKGLLFTLFLLVSFIGHSQLSIKSPYSSYGIGEYEGFGPAAFQGMGNLRFGIIDSMLVNATNPATYSYLSPNRPIFDIGVSGRTTWLSDSTGATDYASAFNFNYAYMGIPFAKRFGAGLGFMPFSKVGYDYVTTEVVNGTDSVEYRYLGDGGVTQVFLAFSGAILNNENHFLSLGAQLDYYIGSNNSIRDAQIINDPEAFVARVESRKRTNDFGATFALAYKYTMAKRTQVSLGATYSPQWDLSGKEEFYAYNYISVGGGASEIPVDSIVATDSVVGVVNYPQRVGFGATVTLHSPSTDASNLNWRLKIGLNTEYVEYETYAESFQSSFVSNNYRNRMSYSLGAEFTPHAPWPKQARQGYNRRNYFTLMRYRLGVQYTSTEIVIDQEPINRVQLHWGLGFPLNLPLNQSSVNFGMAFGKMGTTEAGLLEEKYMSFHVGLTLSPFGDRWFLKRRYD